MKSKATSKNKIPRIIYLKMLYGDDFMDYTKDDYGIRRFLREQLGKEKEKSSFFKTNLLVGEFAIQWLIFTDYYKYRFGQNIRDKDAISRISKENNFKKISDIYKFRCHLFKSDFSPSEDFEEQLKDNVVSLKEMNRHIFEKRERRNKYLINSTEW